jgi:hypothetical protein
LTLDATQYDLEDGQQLYLSISATDSEDASLNTTSTATMTVDGVWSDGDENYLTAGELSFKSSDILKIVEKEETTTQTETNS